MFASPIYARNVNEAFAQGLKLLDNPHLYTEEPSRNGKVRVSNGPVLTVTLNPLERVLFSPLRDANPFFHLFESLWMLAGRNDLPWLAQFNKRMAEYSNDGGKTQPAAYGFRWREYFGYDQLAAIIEELRKDPTTRRATLAMWDPWGIHTMDDGTGAIHHFGDLHGATHGSKDVPCNTHCYFRIRGGKLDMAVSCRSNDVVWGAHGANAVHFSVMQEYVAASVGVEVGVMYQFSFNYHLYDGILRARPSTVAKDAMLYDLYRQGEKSVKPTPIFAYDTMDQFEYELPTFMDRADPSAPLAERVKRRIIFSHPFLRTVAMPMLQAWENHKLSRYDVSWMEACEIPGDWGVATKAWIHRRRERVYAANGQHWTEWMVGELA